MFCGHLKLNESDIISILFPLIYDVVVVLVPNSGFGRFCVLCSELKAGFYGRIHDLKSMFEGDSKIFNSSP